MEIPVYLFTGFLESGKTKMITETMADKRFQNKERTLILVCEDERHMAETFKEIVTNRVEIPQIKLYFTTDLRQNEETLENTLVEFKLIDSKYKMENVELKLLGM